jgi:hypothetical protein
MFTLLIVRLLFLALLYLFLHSLARQMGRG